MSKDMQQMHRRTPMPKYDFNKVALQSKVGSYYSSMVQQAFLKKKLEKLEIVQDVSKILKICEKVNFY